METFEGPGVAVDIGMSSAAPPTTPIAPVSTVPTAPVSTIPSVLVSTALTAPILTVPGPLPTAPSQFEVGSNSATIPDPSGEPLKAPNSYTRIGYNKPSNTRRKMT
nr:hypothetical protein CFP56_74803 [Quercus suber]